ncbi:hypothetical protein HELRODRAFT_142036, partial [Helobdella robusta]|uniref:Neuropeptide Y receptor type 1 n=1 Tax=Helobdella robusta TaxID=6412 RepID=T1EJ47_HELRO
VRIVIVIIYATIVLVGFVSNLAVIIIGMQSCRIVKNRLSVTSILIIVLACSDLCLCVFCLPIQLHYQLTNDWHLGEVMCKIVFSAFALPMYVSVFTILLIAIDRYRLIVCPLKNRISVNAACVSVLLTVIFAVLMASPVMYYLTVLRIESPTNIDEYRILCVEEWSSDWSMEVYSAVTFCFMYCLPMLLTGYFYLRIYLRLQFRNPPLKSHPQKTIKTYKTFNILFLIVTNFTLCWTPWNIFSLIVGLRARVDFGPYFTLVDILLKAFAMLSVCTNPFLYCWLNDRLKKD